MKTMNSPLKALTRLCFFMELLLLISMVLIPLACAYFLYWPFGSTQDVPLPAFVEDPAWATNNNILFVFDNIVIFLVLLQIWFFFRGVRKGELFTWKRISNTRYIGLTLVLAYFMSLIFRIMTGFFHYDYRGDYIFMVSTELYGLLQLLLGAGLIALSYILEQAKKLKDEQDLVI